MLLSFLRHGKAEGHAASDEQRALTEEGKTQINNLAKFLKNNGTVFDLILSSPYKRALETAEIIAEQLNIEDCLFTENELECGANLHDIKSLIRQYNDYENILFVGHAPDLAYISQDLLGTANEVHFKTASFITIDSNIIRPASGLLKLFIHAKSLKNSKN